MSAHYFQLWGWWWSRIGLYRYTREHF